jgi:hypothetical protein
VTGAHWHLPASQGEDGRRERSIEHERLPPAFATTVPLRGVSGVIRRYADARFSEARAAHWLLLLAGDRVDALENHVMALLSGRPDLPLTRTILRDELRNRGGVSGLRTRADWKHQWLDPWSSPDRTWRVPAWRPSACERWAAGGRRERGSGRSRNRRRPPRIRRLRLAGHPRRCDCCLRDCGMGRREAGGGSSGVDDGRGVLLVLMAVPLPTKKTLGACPRHSNGCAYRSDLRSCQLPSAARTGWVQEPKEWAPSTLSRAVSSACHSAGPSSFNRAAEAR